MTFPEVVAREQWLESRKRLLAAEKEETRRRDALNAERRQLPMYRIEKEYLLDGPEGRVPLAGLFGNSRQLVIKHVMFDPDWDAASCGTRPRSFTPTRRGRAARTSWEARTRGWT